MKMAWVTLRRISGILTISKALFTLAIADGDKILHDTKQARHSTVLVLRIAHRIWTEIK